MRIVVTGASGFVGRVLCARLAAAGADVRRLVRRAPRTPDEVAWDPAAGALDPAALAGADAIVHLAGAGIADAPWTAARRAELRASRVGPTALLARAAAACAPAPRVFLSASAIGVYGDRGDDVLDESSERGKGFLADLAAEWEAAAAPAAAAGIRVAHPRLGIVLSPEGGALAKLLAPFRWGAGGPLGTGRQWWSWVTLEDVCGALRFALGRDGVRGPFNVVAPSPARNADLARALGRALGRPALLPAPGFALRTFLGRELADAVLLSSQRVRPAVLEREGFAFRDPALEPALRRILDPGRG